MVSKLVQSWLENYAKESTRRIYRTAWQRFEQWAGKTAEQFKKEYQDAADKEVWAKETGKLVVKYYNHLVRQGFKLNSARALVMPVRAFFDSECTKLRVRKGAIAGQKIAMGEHEFTLSELREMYRSADVRERAILATALSLGWSAEDFVKMKRAEIEPYLEEGLEPPVSFWYERGKTASPTRAHLTHEAIEALRDWLRVAPLSPYVFPNRTTDKPMRTETLNDIIKKMFARTKRKPRGRIRFHLIRKFLMSQLANAGLNQWHVKLIVGKTIPADILTYLKDQTDMIREEFMRAEERISLTGFTNANHSQLETLQIELQELRSALKVIAKYVAKELGHVPIQLKAFVEENEG